MDAQVTECRDGPTLFVGIALEVDEIVMGLNVLHSKVRDLRESCEQKQPIPAKHAADDIAKVSGQINTLSAHLGSVIARYVNSQPKVRS